MSSPTPTADPRTALVVRGGWEGHHPLAATELFIPFLEEHGFRVLVEDSPEVYSDAGRMAEVDLIMQCVSMGTITAEQVAGLIAAVEAGTGLAGWHGGIVDSYRDHPDYLALVGGQFACHPGRPAAERRGEAADGFSHHTIDMLPAAQDHPITAGISSFALHTEQYWVLTDGYVDVLATTTQAVQPGDAWHREVTSPALWTRRWGRGRVFVTTPGHDVQVLQDPNVRTLIERGLLWAARGSDLPYGDHGSSEASR